MPPYKLAGHLYGKDDKKYNAFVTFEAVREDSLRIKIRSSKEGKDFPPSAGLSQGLITQITWLPGMEQRWGKYLDASGNFRKDCKQKGTNAMKECLEQWWLESFPDPRAAKKTVGLKAMAAKADLNGYIPSTNIMASSAHINSNAYRFLDNSATAVIKQFLNGNITVNDQKINGKEFSTLEAIESAFFREDVRIDPAHAISASRHGKKRRMKSIVSSPRWTNKSFHVGPKTPSQIIALLNGKSIQKSFTGPDSDELKPQPMAKLEATNHLQRLNSKMASPPKMPLDDITATKKRKQSSEVASGDTPNNLPSIKRAKVKDDNAEATLGQVQPSSCSVLNQSIAPYDRYQGRLSPAGYDAWMEAGQPPVFKRSPDPWWP